MRWMVAMALVLGACTEEDGTTPGQAGDTAAAEDGPGPTDTGSDPADDTDGTGGSPAGSSDGTEGGGAGSDDGTAAADVSDTTGAETGDGTETATDDASTGASTGESAFVGVCSGEAALSMSVAGSAQDAHEGHRVWAVAVEPMQDVNVPEIVAYQQDVVTGGAFSLTCAMGLSENFAYPSIAVVLDADDDGVCSAGDVAFYQQLFGWDADQAYVIDGAVASSTGDPPFVVSEDAWTSVEAIGEVWSTPFCTYYFPDP